jgi:hypothetical protein
MLGGIPKLSKELNPHFNQYVTLEGYYPVFELITLFHKILIQILSIHLVFIENEEYETKVCLYK